MISEKSTARKYTRYQQWLHLFGEFHFFFAPLNGNHSCPTVVLCAACMWPTLNQLLAQQFMHL